jgi:hypothetical protein
MPSAFDHLVSLAVSEIGSKKRKLGHRGFPTVFVSNGVKKTPSDNQLRFFPETWVQNPREGIDSAEIAAAGFVPLKTVDLTRTLGKCMLVYFDKTRSEKFWGWYLARVVDFPPGRGIRGLHVEWLDGYRSKNIPNPSFVQVNNREEFQSLFLVPSNQEFWT